jgi:hypothetical protein
VVESLSIIGQHSIWFSYTIQTKVNVIEHFLWNLSMPNGVDMLSAVTEKRLQEEVGRYISLLTRQFYTNDV